MTQNLNSYTLLERITTTNTNIDSGERKHRVYEEPRRTMNCSFTQDRSKVKPRRDRI